LRGDNFYRKRKNPVLGVILVLFFGPLGFLYHSWKSALLLLFVILPLWIVLLRGTQFDLITHSWVLYTTLVTLAIVALYQITAANDDNSDD
jgi:hypothetical protein